MGSLLGLLSFTWLAIVQHKSNSALKAQIVLWDSHDKDKVIYCAANLAGTVALIYIVFSESQLWHRLLFMSPTVPGDQLTCWAALWTIAVNDISLSMIAMILKCGVLLLCANRGVSVGYRRQIFTLTESAMTLWRTTAPVPVWYFYFSSGKNTIVASLCAGLYLAIKLTAVVEQSKHLGFMAKGCINGEAVYGRFATPEELAACHDDCSICQGPHRGAIVLPCEHIFCEECVSVWLDREPTCPNCRSQVAPEAAKGAAAGGGGPTSLMPHVF